VGGEVVGVVVRLHRLVVVVLGDVDLDLGAGVGGEDQDGRHDDGDQDELEQLLVFRQRLGAGGRSRVPVPHVSSLCSSRGEVAPTGGRGLRTLYCEPDNSGCC